jgi:hypothetical protein
MATFFDVEPLYWAITDIDEVSDLLLDHEHVWMDAIPYNVFVPGKEPLFYVVRASQEGQTEFILPFLINPTVDNPLWAYINDVQVPVISVHGYHDPVPQQSDLIKPDWYGTTVGSNIPLLNGYTSAAKRIKYIPSGIEVPILGRNQNYFHINYNGTSGYVHYSYIKVKQKGYETDGKIIDNNVKVYSNSSATSVYTTLSANDFVRVENQYMDLYEVTLVTGPHAGATGYIYTRYVDIIYDSDSIGIVTEGASGPASDIIVRTAPAINASTFKHYTSTGHRFKVLEKSNDWYKIVDDDGSTAYIYAYYLKVMSASDLEPVDDKTKVTIGVPAHAGDEVVFEMPGVPLLEDTVCKRPVPPQGGLMPSGSLSKNYVYDRLRGKPEIVTYRGQQLYRARTPSEITNRFEYAVVSWGAYGWYTLLNRKITVVYQTDEYGTQTTETIRLTSAQPLYYNRFFPDACILVHEALSILERLRQYLYLAYSDTQPPQSYNDRFVNVDSSMPFYHDVLNMGSLRLSDGTYVLQPVGDSNLNPYGYITKAQTAALLNKFRKWAIETFR